MNLTETALFTRRAAVILVAFVFSFFILKATFGVAGKLLTLINPPPPPVVTTIFGKLPPLNIQRLPVENNDTISYTLDTPTGKFPALPTRANVYKIPHSPATLLSESRARAFAKLLQFNNEPTRVSSSELRWSDIAKSRDLSINIVTGIFTLTTEPAKVALDLNPGSAPTQAQAINLTLAFFTNKQFLTPDYIQGTQTTSLIKTVAGQYRQAQSLSEAQVTRVNLFRQIDKLNVYGPNPKKGLIWADVSALPFPDQLTNLNYYNWSLDYNKPGNYPLKSPETALLEFKSGRSGFVYLNLKGQDAFASYSPLNLSQVSIRAVELAYYDSELLQDYLQPIYVLSGIFKTTGGSEGEFSAYVPAVDSSWIASN